MSSPLNLLPTQLSRRIFGAQLNHIFVSCGKPFSGKSYIELLGVSACDKASGFAVVMLQAPKGATQSAGVVVEQSAGCMYVKVKICPLFQPTL